MPDQDDSLLLYLNDAIATTRNKEDLFRNVTEKLRLIFPFDAITILSLDMEHQYRRVFLRDYLGDVIIPDISNHKYHRAAIERTPIEGFVRQTHIQHYNLEQLLQEYGSFQPFHALLNQGMRYLTVVPLRTGGRLIGLLSLVARRQPDLSEQDADLLEKIGSLVAVAVTNALAFEDIARREQEKTMQLALNNALLSIKERGELFRAIATEINQVVSYDYFGVRIRQPDSPVRALAEFSKQPDGSFLALDENRFDDLPQSEASKQAVLDLFSKPGVYVGADFEALARRYDMLRYIREQRGTQSILCAPLDSGDESSAVVILASYQPLAFREETLQLLLTLVPQIRLAIQNVLAFEQIDLLRTQLERERTYLIDEINTTAAARLDDFVGGSAVMQQVYTRLAQVAPTDTTVLIEGETGTGKELVARALHNLSPRAERALIKLNCAALPAQLIESELFGHEKGAFTGAHDRRIGKFELADGGTIFLDEVGELPLDLQAKLLRVLQEKEFERIGGRRVISSNVRVIAATNRVLEEEVAAGRFRADLYYRLNVFPIRLPALRERPEDIEPLMRHFLERFTKQMGKPVRGLRERDLRAMQQYGWPGNVRELEHVLEQAVIVSQGPFLEFAGFSAVAQAAQAPTATPEAGGPIKTLKDQERDHILAALRRTGGRVSGPTGAAVLLDINPKTLEARMKKLGIQRTITAG
ncbi:sigma-54-dependent Fis family transcriptional regulator [Hymenobacter taeanensis]|uniref:Sigma-54-dependent Fis family transcriptional regulator n=1 Tax=Hymenobacter taeanensis TaxID=2735321 RepID=A0A6M6BG59_9BACT|nr:MULTISPECIES: sigma-54-dependent Fis family transcriptional regulator [Hymenobacter]QJX47000.1 sigma-54-dependent Fis family transcriptional regulator [Hymenobacter taeanensis]UOQ80876.1 sigma-54-dependent Fis family transcriptional regulator [Hymenobacter sp. 5414T-23]